ncbi:hypothetical protein [Effusibacillus consociatus]|uniref:Uncharacterized protein n=1 Tax=Effusibacillus consociatus TaxID=1117041 RepID=A0ABV9PZR9_9BACL
MSPQEDENIWELLKLFKRREMQALKAQLELVKSAAIKLRNVEEAIEGAIEATKEVEDFLRTEKQRLRERKEFLKRIDKEIERIEQEI